MKALRFVAAMVLGFGLAGFASKAQSGGRIEPGLLQKLRANPNANFDVVLRFDTDAPPPGASRSEVIRALQGGLGRRLSQVNAVIGSYGLRLEPARDALWLDSSVLVRLPGKAIEVLAAISSVDLVFENFKLRIPKVQAFSQTSAPASQVWHLERVGVAGVWAAGWRGQGVRVGHLDTGIDATHPELEGRLAAFAEFDARGDRVNAAPHDSASHGTHTAGLIVGRKVGVAPEAKLLSALVLPNGEGTFAQVVAGMQWVLDPDNNPSSDDGARIVSMSLGLSGMAEAFVAPTQNLVRAGVLPVFAAGNFGPQAGTIASPGNLPEPLTVGAVDERNALAAFSSRGPVRWGNSSYNKPDLLAPGVNVTSLAPGGQYVAMTGTSQAVPLVAGLAALLRSAQPSADGQVLKRALKAGARGVGDPNAVGKGVAYAPGALEALGVNGGAPEAKPAQVAANTQMGPQPLIRELLGIPADGVLRGLLEPGPRAVLGAQISSLEFKLLDQRGWVVYERLERDEPYCMAGDHNGRCDALDTRELPNGRFTLLLRATLLGGGIKEFRAQVLIDNPNGKTGG